MGSEIRSDPRDERPRRSRLEKQPARRALRQGVLRLYRARVFPPTTRWRAGSVPAVRQSGVAWEMNPRDESARSSRGNEAEKSRDSLLTSAATKADDREPPGVPGFRTWRG